MKIGVISDTHGDTQAWEKSIKYFDGARFILHSGDVLYHGVFNPILDSYDGKILAEMINKSPVPLVFARGNCDSDVDQLALEYPIESLITETVIDGLNILIHHGDKYSNKDLADKYRPDIIISGHTHVFGIERYKDTIFLNPGSPSLPKNPEQIPTVAVINDGKISILDLDGKALVEEII
ncbi:hypothetical protein LCGC14_0525900 [marine sediment metagenome]|uniref:Calcineurin-like phosphoesterase domain-containing protein n=1 Tax=marine sediment metagenome TaxID=412755 RepID=A0A0F9UIG5_9ZZZZ|nr:phosphodiesterase [Actinomycetota bacterium]